MFELHVQRIEKNRTKDNPELDIFIEISVDILFFFVKIFYHLILFVFSQIICNFPVLNLSASFSKPPNHSDVELMKIICSSLTHQWSTKEFKLLFFYFAVVEFTFLCEIDTMQTLMNWADQLTLYL